MSKIKKPILPPKTPDRDVKTPLTAKAIPAKKSIILHENYGLREALMLKQKKRKKGKKLNLYKEEDISVMYWGADVVVKAVEFQAEKDRLQVLEDEAKERRKI
ncbi:hypothetical protein ACEPPN_003566 [Leptodophora sp. 'Broadleaf-Isolate-01']